ncbi:hypothetical protein HYC85_002008 [Camellia sinensis]|uniref:DUF632 domain-containing protein n=1 Tax=Camellia sinensis TaxID=4442 RepID=A0A7J7I796_CAMSI|nr:hypothetical protein HYC85_002008 [Camellia sinensis]
MFINFIIIDEERLRGIYAKEQKKLKKLDDRGVESSKIDATYNSIKKLLLKINVAVSTVDAISKRINKLRDEELRPRLNELILSRSSQGCCRSSFFLFARLRCKASMICRIRRSSPKQLVLVQSKP